MNGKMGLFVAGAIGLTVLVCGSGAWADDLDDLAKVVSGCNELKDKQRELNTQYEGNLNALPMVSGLPDYGKASVETTVAQKGQLSEFYGNVIKDAEVLISQARQAQGPERRKLIKQAEQIVNQGKSMVHVQINMGDSFKSLMQISDDTKAAQKNTDPVAMKSAMDSAWPQDKAGGVFINRTVEISGLDRSSVSRAEYRLNEKRFALYENSGKTWLLPPMDPDMVAVVIKCLYHQPSSRREIAVSLGIDPVNMGRYSAVQPDYDKVLFGCEALHDTEVGRILIDADDMNNNLWQGMNHDGEILTEKFGYHSLLQMTLDHPANNEIINVDFMKRKIDVRVWIRPETIVLYKAGENDLQFRPVSFRMFSETIIMDSPKSFTGTHMPNPGADVFTAFFSNNFSKFVSYPLRTEEHTGRIIRPLLEVQEVARIVSVVRWVKGEGLGKPAIQMETSWASGYGVKKVPTDRQLYHTSLTPILKTEIRGPIVIYNEYGPSRIIDNSGHIKRVKYENGRIKSVNPEYR